MLADAFICKQITKTMDIEVAAKKAINYVTFCTSNKMFQVRINTRKDMQRRNIQSNGQRDRPWQIPGGHDISGNDTLPLIESCCLSTTRTETDTDTTRVALSI